MHGILRLLKSSRNGFLKKNKPTVDKRTAALLNVVSQAAQALKIKWMVTGAAGRMMLLEGVYGLPHGRATHDVDLGVMVANWSQYQRLVAQICKNADCVSDPKQRQRLSFRKDGILDLIPFGGIESKDRTIRWPPKNDFVMSVMGFREAYEDAVPVEVEGIVVPVVSPVGLMLLKLVAWAERRYSQPRKDAADMAYILSHFSEVLTKEVLFDQHLAELEAESYDIDLAASRILGQRMAAMTGKDTQQFLCDLLNRELQEASDAVLVRDVAANMGAKGEERTYQLLERLKTGFEGGVKAL